MRLPFEVERRLRKFCISGLMRYIVVGTAVTYLVALVTQFGLIGQMTLERDLVFQGQLWRLITFVFVPSSLSPLWALLSLYFYFMIGTQVENSWGTVKFNLYYWIGVLGAIAAAMLTGYATNTFLNLSLFFAFAILNPQAEVRLFFAIPIQIKYLALANALYYLYVFIVGDWSTRAMILFSLLNLFLFLGGDFINWVRRDARHWKTRYNFRKNMR